MSSHPLNQYYSKIYRTYDRVNRLFTLGMDRRWRKITAKVCLESNASHVIDLCCGTGDLSMMISKLSGERVAVTGYDRNPEMLGVAREKSQKTGLHSIKFIQGDAANMPFADCTFDALTIAFGFRNLTYENENRADYLQEMNRILKSGARMYILESAVPTNPVIRFLQRLYLRLFLVPLGGIISGNWNAYRYLAISASNFYRPAEMAELLDAHGFGLLHKRIFFPGAASLMIAVKK